MKKNAASLFGLELQQDAVEHLFRRTVMDRAVRLTDFGVPVLRIDQLQDVDVIEARAEHNRRDFVFARRFGVGVVRRTKQHRRPVQDALEDALRRCQLEARLAVRHRSEVRVGIRVIADLVTFIPDAPNEIRVTFGVLSDEKERRFDVFLFQNVEHLHRVRRGRTIVDGQRNHSRLVAFTRDHE